MKRIKPEELNERENYKFLTGSIIPRPIAFVTTLSEQGVLNAAPFSFFNVVSNKPPRISVAVQRKQGIQKDTARNAAYRKSFVVHIVDESYLEAVNQTSANLDSEESEIELAGLTPVESEVVDVPGIKEAKIRFECELDQVVNFADEEVTTDLLIGKIVCYHLKEELYERGRINPDLLNPVCRLAGSNYALLGEKLSLDRPE